MLILPLSHHQLKLKTNHSRHLIAVLVWSLGLFLGLNRLITQPCQAQTQTFALSVSPPTAYLSVKPGMKVTHSVVLKNEGRQSLDITPKIVDFEPDGHTGNPRLTKQLTFPYFELPDEGLQPLTLAPGQKAKVSLVIAPPTGVPSQEYPMTILFRAQAKQDPNRTGYGATTAVSGTVASNLVVLVSGRDQPQGKLVIDKIELPLLVDSFRPINFKLLAKNQGLAASVASGSAEIVNWRDEPVATFQLFPLAVLGHTTRYLQAVKQDNQSNQVQPGKFITQKKLWLGVYRVRVRLNQDSVKLKTVVALPLSLLVLSGIGIMTALGVILAQKWGLRFSS